MFPVPRSVLSQLSARNYVDILNMIEMQAVVRAAQLSRIIGGPARPKIMQVTKEHAKRITDGFSPSTLKIWPHLTLAVAVALLRLGLDLPLAFSIVDRVAELADNIFRPRGPRGGMRMGLGESDYSTEQLELASRLPVDASAFLHPCAHCNPFNDRSKKPRMICYGSQDLLKCVACTRQRNSGCVNHTVDVRWLSAPVAFALHSHNTQISNPHFKRMVVPRSHRAVKLGEALRSSLAGRVSQVLELAAFAKLDSAAVAADAATTPVATIREELRAAGKELFEAYNDLFRTCARAEAAGVDAAAFLKQIELTANASPADL